MILIVLIISLSACGTVSYPDGADGAVISVEDRSVFPESISDSFERFRGDTTSVNIFKENIIARELFIVDAVATGLDLDREVQRLVHERTREILQAQWLSFNLDQVELTPETIRGFWETMGTGVRYTCFYHSDSLVMDSVLNMVQDGRHLSEFAVSLGIDQMLVQSKGLIAIDDRNFSNVMDYPYLITGEPGDIITPFPVTMGWRMLQIDSMWTYEVAPFSVDSGRIASMLLSRERESRKKFLEDSLKTAYNVQINMDAIEIIAANASEDGSSFGIFGIDQEDIIVVTWDGGERSLYSVTNNILGLPNYYPRYTKNIIWLTQYAERLAMFDIEMHEAQLLGLDTIPEIAYEINSKKWENVLDKYYEVVIAPRINPDSVFVHDIYFELRDDMPVAETRVFHVLFLASIEKIAIAEAMMAADEDILAEIDQFELFPPILSEGEQTLSVPLKKSQIPPNDQDVLFNLAVDDEAIISLSDSTSLWLRLEKIEEERIPTFEDIRDRVLAEANQRSETAVIEALVDSLSNEYHLYVNEEYFQQFYIPAESDSVNINESAEEVL